MIFKLHSDAMQAFSIGASWAQSINAFCFFLHYTTPTQKSKERFDFTQTALRFLDFLKISYRVNVHRFVGTVRVK